MDTRSCRSGRGRPSRPTRPSAGPTSSSSTRQSPCARSGRRGFASEGVSLRRVLIEREEANDVIGAWEMPLGHLATKLKRHRHVDQATLLVARREPRLRDRLERADLGSSEVRKHARRLAAREVDDAARDLARVDRLELPAQGDGGDARHAREAAQQNLHELVELRRAQYRPRHAAFLDHTLRGDLRPVVGVTDSVDADYGNEDDVADVRRPCEFQKAASAADVGGATAPRFTGGRRGVDDDLHAGERPGDALTGPDIALDRVDVTARVPAQDARAVS